MMSGLPESLFLNPVWHALHGPHRHLARGEGGACRYPADVAPFAAIDAPSRAAFAELCLLLDPDESVWIVDYGCPAPGLAVVDALECVQMVLPEAASRCPYPVRRAAAQCGARAGDGGAHRRRISGIFSLRHVSHGIFSRCARRRRARGHGRRALASSRPSGDERHLHASRSPRRRVRDRRHPSPRATSPPRGLGLLAARRCAQSDERSISIRAWDSSPCAASCSIASTDRAESPATSETRCVRAFRRRRVSSHCLRSDKDTWSSRVPRPGRCRW